MERELAVGTATPRRHPDPRSDRSVTAEQTTCRRVRVRILYQPFAHTGNTAKDFRYNFCVTHLALRNTHTHTRAHLTLFRSPSPSKDPLVDSMTYCERKEYSETLETQVACKAILLGINQTRFPLLVTYATGHGCCHTSV